MPTLGYCRHAHGRDFEDAANLLASTPSLVDALITHRFPIDDAAEAYRVAADKSTGALRRGDRPIMKNVMNHVGQCVTDLERSRTFYVDVLGFELWRILDLGRAVRPAAPPDAAGRHPSLLPAAGRVRARAAPLRRLRRRPAPVPGAHDERARAHPRLGQRRRHRRRPAARSSSTAARCSRTRAWTASHLRARSRRPADRAAAHELRRTDRSGRLIAVDLGLRDRVAIVTGASKGIGRQVAADLGAEGCHVVLLRTSTRTRYATRPQPPGVRRACCRRRPTSSCTTPPTTSCERATDEFGRVDILVNNAGGNTPAPAAPPQPTTTGSKASSRTSSPRCGCRSRACRSCRRSAGVGS